MIEFAWPWLFLLIPLPWLVRWLLSARKQPQLGLRVPRVTPIGGVMQLPANRWPALVLASLAWIALVTAVARPEWLGDPLPIRSEAREMMLAVDLSGSMEIADMEINNRQANRLQMVKHVLSDFIERRKGDRLGLILFADTAYLQTPMTYDRHTVGQMLAESQLNLIGERTAIGDAVALAVKRFEQRGDTNRVLVLLTDGQNTAGYVTPDQSLELAKAYGVKIYTIGVGAEEVVVQSFFGERRVNPSRDLDESLLSNLAEQTGGVYFRARNTEELEAIYAELDQFEPVSGDEQQRRPRTALSHWPLAAALIFSLLLWLQNMLQQRLWQGSRTGRENG